MSSSSSSSNIRVLRAFPKISDIYLFIVCIGVEHTSAPVRSVVVRGKLVGAGPGV